MMQNYSELVEALRLCQFGECGCGKCYYKELKGDWCTEDNHPEFFDCDDKLKLDAAAAIDELQKTLKAVQKNSGINFRMWEEAQAEVKRLQDKIDALQAEVEQLKAELIDCVCNGDLD